MWTCRAADNPLIVELIDGATKGSEAWFERLECEAESALHGKVLCVCAGAVIARRALVAEPGSPLSEQALALLEGWIDEPTEARFAHIAALLFGDDGGGPQPELDEIAWWALRVATSSVGNFEAGWALGALCDVALNRGLAFEEVRTHGLAAVRERLK